MNAKESSSANKSAHIIEINLRGKIASIQKDAVYDHFSTFVDDGIVHVDGYDRKFRIHLRSFDHLKSLESCIRKSLLVMFVFAQKLVFPNYIFTLEDNWRAAVV